MHRALQEELSSRLSTVIVLNIATMLMSDGTCNVTAGMGAFEYFQLAEALGAEPLWVINNGISHTYSVPAENIWPLVQVLLATPVTTTTTLSTAMFTVLACNVVCYSVHFLPCLSSGGLICWWSCKFAQGMQGLFMYTCAVMTMKMKIKTQAMSRLFSSILS